MDEFYEKYQLNSEWLIKQTGRPDADERIIAFYESVHQAIITDDENWYNKGYDYLCAMLSNNATELLIGLCGWGPANLARRVFLKRGCPQYCDEELHCTLNVDWSDNARTSASCIVRHADHKVYDFDYGVFIPA